MAEAEPEITDSQQSNPLRMDGLNHWLEELTDVEAISLLERVSDDIKRRNGLLVTMSAGSPDNAIRNIVEALVGRKSGA